MGQRRAFRGLPPWEEIQAARVAAELSRMRPRKEEESRDLRNADYRVLTQRAVSQDNIAKDSYSDLLSAGVTQPELLELLAGIAVLLPTRGKIPKWFRDLGKTAEQLKAFPSRIEAMAGEIETLNKHPMLRPDEWVKARGIAESAKRHFAVWFARLPLLVCHYAAFVRAHCKRMSDFLLKEHRIAPRTRVLRALVSLVRRETGSPRYTHLSNVLIATALLAGKPEKGLDPDSLKSLDTSRPTKQKPTERTKPTR